MQDANGYQIGITNSHGDIIAILSAGHSLEQAEFALSGFEVSILAPGVTLTRELPSSPSPGRVPRKSRS